MLTEKLKDAIFEIASTYSPLDAKQYRNVCCVCDAAEIDRETIDCSVLSRSDLKELIEEGYEELITEHNYRYHGDREKYD